jgi:hypothetical protein
MCDFCDFCPTDSKSSPWSTNCTHWGAIIPRHTSLADRQRTRRHATLSLFWRVSLQVTALAYGKVATLWPLHAAVGQHCRDLSDAPPTDARAARREAQRSRGPRRMRHETARLAVLTVLSHCHDLQTTVGCHPKRCRPQRAVHLLVLHAPAGLLSAVRRVSPVAALQHARPQKQPAVVSQQRCIAWRHLQTEPPWLLCPKAAPPAWLLLARRPMAGTERACLGDRLCRLSRLWRQTAVLHQPDAQA